MIIASICLINNAINPNIYPTIRTGFVEKTKLMAVADKLFDAWISWKCSLILSIRVPGCQKINKWRLNPVRHRMLYSCAHMATVGVKELNHRLGFWLLFIVRNWFVTDTTSDEYLLYESIAMIPGRFDVIEMGDTTRTICRQLCSVTYNLICSGFLYNRHVQNCQLSAYTGEWVTAANVSLNISAGLEFYRRIRCAG